MSPNDVEVLRKRLLDRPDDLEAEAVFVDALLESDDPLKAYVGGPHRVSPRELPGGVSARLFNGLAELVSRASIVNGVVRGLSVSPRRPSLFRRAVRQLEWRGVRVVTLPFWSLDEEVAGPPAGQLAALLARDEARCLVEVRSMTFDTFVALCGMPRDLDRVTLVGLPQWGAHDVASGPGLRVREVCLGCTQNEPIGPALAWLMTYGRATFDVIEGVRTPTYQQGSEQLLSPATGRSLTWVDSGRWRATRGADGWHATIGEPATGTLLYEDLVANLQMSRHAAAIAEVAPLVQDIVLELPQVPEGELERFRKAAGRTPIGFRMGHPGEEPERAARGLEPRRFDAGAPLLEEQWPF